MCRDNWKDNDFKLKCAVNMLRENRLKREKEQQNAELQDTPASEGDTDKNRISNG